MFQQYISWTITSSTVLSPKCTAGTSSPHCLGWNLRSFFRGLPPTQSTSRCKWRDVAGTALFPEERCPHLSKSRPRLPVWFTLYPSTTSGTQIPLTILSETGTGPVTVQQTLLNFLQNNYSQSYNDTLKTRINLWQQNGLITGELKLIINVSSSRRRNEQYSSAIRLNSNGNQTVLRNGIKRSIETKAQGDVQWWSAELLSNTRRIREYQYGARINQFRVENTDKWLIKFVWKFKHFWC